MSRFITSFAQIAAPLRQLTKSTSTFQWGPIEQEAFDSLRSSLTEKTTLSYIVPERPIRIYVDAGKKTDKSSNVPGGLCAILCQQDDDGQAPLRNERQILAIQGLDYVIKYKKGAEKIADYGSRHLTKRHDDVPMVKFVNELEEGLRTFVSKDNEYLSRMAKDDNDYQFPKEVIQRNLWKKHRKDPRVSRFLGVASDLSVVGEIILCKDNVNPPLSSRRRFLEKAHKIGHSGETRTLKLLQEKIWFPGIAKLCKEAVRNCQSCQVTHDRTYDEPLQSTPLPPDPWHTISVDFKGPFKDRTYTLVGYDLYSRYPVVSYCRSTAFSCVKPILDSWFSTFDTVKELKSDRGPPFNGREFSAYARERRFIHKPMKPRHSKGNGEAEKCMQNVKKMERIAKQERKKYRCLIEGMLNAYRATPHPATEKSPFELTFGRKCDLEYCQRSQKHPNMITTLKSDKMMPCIS
ncbi:Retrovirus-related Pol poly from transposon [Paramuricea clavata]|uniref:Retrovirus-related Pol poly from transposon n=1 Tax=Paramuricea clavata TaxID=317549 RepID=A0A6S7GIZ3_PARCT|nr:Retrovirus-related Pol poly from transposon [Paramuricea clavata]